MAKKITASPRKETFDLRAFIAKTNAQYGEGTILLASEAKNLEIEFISSGCYALDFITGGGIPLNRITQFVGAYSSCKTTLTLTTIREFQKAYPDGYCGFIDVEFALDLAYAKLLGVDLDRLLIVRPDSGEQTVDVLMDTMKQDIPLIVALDSIPGVIPLAELETTVEQNFMGKHPQLINRMVKMANARLKRSLTEDAAPTVVLLLNQLREKVGLVFGNPETTPGGRGKDFFAGLTITLRGGEKINEEVERNGMKRKLQVAREFNAQATKNKVGGRPFEETKFTYFIKTFGEQKFGTFNNAEVLFEFGVFYGVIKAGKKFSYKCKFGLIEKGRESEFISCLRARPKTSGQLYKDILTALQDDNRKDLSPEEAPAEAPAASEEPQAEPVE